MVEPPIDLGARRAERAEREADRARHPALRWCAGTAFYVAHRRDEDGIAACGARGDLILAPPGVPTCVECYPIAERGVT